jgi:arabinan endo-1,5-alpha-L-arabinosidase
MTAGFRDTDIANIIGVSPREVSPWSGGETTPAPQNGGSLPLATTGRFIGPGGQEALKTSKGDMLAYPYYDGDAGGQLSPIRWTFDDWPELDPLPQ